MKTLNIKLLFSAMALVAGIFYLVSCDKIEEPFTTPTGSNDTAACPVPEFPAVTELKKRVLLEDYTGHTCVNCPKAAVTAHNLKETYGDQLVLLAVHAGFFANPTASGDFIYDFRSEAGTAWDSFFGVGMVGNPNGLINRIGYPNNHITAPAGWGAAVGNALATGPLVDLQVINEYDATERKLCTHVKTRFITSIDRNLKLIVVLTESGIIEPQKNNDADVGVVPIIFDYVHNHVLRTAITSTWGNAVSAIGTANPESVVKTFKHIVNEAYIVENCTVVAFVYDDDTKEVLQAVEADVIQ
ncbi:MAG: Omp28 family outer membrane lipoprotein [Bacteroidales bacterium]|nr:Omp28 family outer membrane lipoprotein [Bacteroidales bacterium]